MVKRRNKNTFTWPWQGEGWQAEHKGLMPFEWVVIAYIAFTLLIVLFTSTKLTNPETMIWERVRVGATIIALWIVYRLLPCRFTMFVRVAAQMGHVGMVVSRYLRNHRMFRTSIT